MAKAKNLLGISSNGKQQQRSKKKEKKKPRGRKEQEKNPRVDRMGRKQRVDRIR